MGILGTIMGRREPAVEYRTVDGGHPAPYPDMTDEQLYNYEVTFNVPRRTFDRPPRPAKPVRPETKYSPPPHHEKAFDAPRYTARTTREAPAATQPVHTANTNAGEPPLDLNKPVRTITTKQPVEIITTRARHPVYKVHGYIGNDDVVTVFTLEGQITENGPRFLENVPRTQQLYLNIYPNCEPLNADKYVVTQHDTKEQAEDAAKPGRITCVAVQFDL